MWDTMATGFQKGLETGVDWQDMRTRREALMQKVAEENTARAEGLVKDQITRVDSWSQSIPSRTPESEKAIAAARSQLDDTIKMLAASPLESARQSAAALSSYVNFAWPQITMTASERNTEKLKVEEAASLQRYKAAYGTGQQAAVPQVAAPTATAMPAAQPSPMGAVSPNVGMPAPAEMAQAAPQRAMATPITAPITVDKMEPVEIESLLASPDEEARAMFEQQYGPGSAGMFLDEPPEPGSQPMSYEQFKQRELLGGETKEQEYMAKKRVEMYERAMEVRRDSLSTIRTNLDQRLLLEQGIYAGLGSTWYTDFQKFKRFVSGEPNPKLSRTEAFMYAAGSKAGKLIKQFGAGTGLSDSDLKFAMMLAIGDQSMSPEGMKMGLDASTKSAAWAMQNPGKGSWEETRSRIIAKGLVTQDQLNHFEELYGSQ